ncbi:hypothetical protein C8F04DRAFT_1266297 [Mycena alexandri]|uniref:Uncharacterized protein n=1 Tax=Mycena alexandri TaxID=1745969 RepID=A0AAD6X0T6_9AGAR|nr:hypothetical protein C8F04DRAFT_1266297 [Mycena alexandri]
MPAHAWTTAAQFTLLTSHMAEYVVRHAQKKVNKVWPTIFEDFFRQNPVAGMLGIDKATVTPEQWKELQDAILLKKSQIKAWFRYQHKKTTRTTSARRSVQSTIGNALFAAKPTRRRVHRATEVFQQRNLEHVREVLAQRGHNELNEEHMAVDGEDLEVQEVRAKVARGERLRMQNEVVKELYETAPESEREAIAEAIRLEKENLGASAERSASEVETQQRQIAIDESSDVMEKVLKTVAHKTGWFSFAIWGGPNPRHDGELSLKCAVYGNTPVGNDFVAQHTNFDEGISLPFQKFLHRCFENSVLRPPIVNDVTNDMDSLDASDDSPMPPAPAPAAKKTGKLTEKMTGKAKPKRVRKPKRAVPAVPAPAPATAAVSATPVPTPSTPPLDQSVDDMLDSDSAVLNNDEWADTADAGPTDNIFSSPLATPPPDSPSGFDSTSSTSLPLRSTAADYWPEGMTAPTSPRTAARAGAAERGGFVSTATYVPAPVIDPALMQGTPPPAPLARPCFNGAEFVPNRAVGQSPTSTPVWRSGGASALHLRPVSRATEKQAGGSQSRLTALFGSYRDPVATSPVCAYRDQEAYRRDIAARPRADIFGFSATARPPALSSTAPYLAFKSSSPTTAPRAFVPAAPSSFSTTSPPAATAQIPTPPDPPAQTPAPAVYPSRPMANPTKAALAAAKKATAKAAVTGNSAAAVMAAASKKRGRKPKRDILTGITNDITTPAPVPDPSAATPSMGGSTGRSCGSGDNAARSAATNENVQLCVAGPSGMRAELKRQKEAEKTSEGDGGRGEAPRESPAQPRRAPPRPDEGAGPQAGPTGPTACPARPKGKRGGACREDRDHEDQAKDNHHERMREKMSLNFVRLNAYA